MELERYNFKVVEEKWQNYWLKNKIFKAEIIDGKKKFYCLEMFPYPSGKIHMGHVRNYTIGDVLARYKSLQGYNVLHPMGWDSFGMPAENAARQNNLDPKDWTEKNITAMKNQLKKLGLSIDWDREISTCSPDYYKHQQQFFLELYDKGLVYRKENYVNWDPIDQTVLANEQVIDGKGWRSGAPVERKKLNQWFFNISKFSNDLLEGLDQLDEWPNKVKVMQKNWIGKSFGCEIDFQVEGNPEVKSISCFTTRPDTLFGFSFLAVSVDHPISKLYNDDAEFINFLYEISRSPCQFIAPPVCSTTMHFLTLGHCSSASSAIFLRGIILPARTPSSAVIRYSESQSLILVDIESGEKPPNIIECTAPIRAHANMV